MNSQLCEQILTSLPDALPERQAASLRELAEWMDRRELWLTSHQYRNGILRVTFSDAARDYTLTTRQMEQVLRDMARGAPFPWEDLADPTAAPAADPTPEAR